MISKMQCRHGVLAHAPPVERAGTTGLNTFAVHPFNQNLVFLRASNCELPAIAFFDILFEIHLAVVIQLPAATGHIVRCIKSNVPFNVFF